MDDGFGGCIGAAAAFQKSKDHVSSDRGCLDCWFTKQCATPNDISASRRRNGMTPKSSLRRPNKMILLSDARASPKTRSLDCASGGVVRCNICALQAHPIERREFRPRTFDVIQVSRMSIMARTSCDVSSADHVQSHQKDFPTWLWTSPLLPSSLSSVVWEQQPLGPPARPWPRPSVVLRLLPPLVDRPRRWCLPCPVAVRLARHPLRPSRCPRHRRPRRRRVRMPLRRLLWLREITESGNNHTIAKRGKLTTPLHILAESRAVLLQPRLSPH